MALLAGNGGNGPGDRCGGVGGGGWGGAGGGGGARRGRPGPSNPPVVHNVGQNDGTGNNMAAAGATTVAAVVLLLGSVGRSRPVKLGDGLVAGFQMDLATRDLDDKGGSDAGLTGGIAGDAASAGDGSGTGDGDGC